MTPERIAELREWLKKRRAEFKGSCMGMAVTEEWVVEFWYYRDLLLLLGECEKTRAGASFMRKNDDRAEAEQKPDGTYHSEFYQGATFPFPPAPSPGLSDADERANDREALYWLEEAVDSVYEIRRLWAPAAKGLHDDFKKRHEAALTHLRSRLAKPAPPAEIITDEKARELLTKAGYIGPPSGEEERKMIEHFDETNVCMDDCMGYCRICGRIRALIWKCGNCGDYNMHPINTLDFECIACGSLFTAGAHSEIVWKKP